MRAARHLWWQALLALLGMILVGGMLAGQAREKPPQAFSPSPTPIVRGGIYTEALIGAPSRFNPLLDYANPVDRDVDRLIFSGLTRFDPTGRPTPDLANWVVTTDTLKYTFILKPSAQWHDGAPVTTQDVAFTIGLIQNSAVPVAPELRQLWQAVSVTVGNAQIITFTLPEPYAPFLDYTTFGLLPSHLLQGRDPQTLLNDPFNLRPIGSGPFRVAQLATENTTLTGLALAAFDGFYGPQALLAEVHFKFYRDSALALAAYRAGEVNGIRQLDATTLPAALVEPNLGLYTTVLPEYSLIYFNLTSAENPFFQEKRVRQALWRSLNRAAMASDIFNGQALPADSPIVLGSWAHNPDLPQIDYDPEGAVKLLEGAGWVLPAEAIPNAENYIRQKGATQLRFTLTVPNTPQHLALAQAAQTQWAKIGVWADLNPVDPATVRRDYLESRPRAFEAVLVDVSFIGTPDPDPYPFWHETQIESGQNYGGFVDRIMSQQLEQARIAPDVATRARLYYNFQSRFTDQTPALLLLCPVYNYAVDTRVTGVRVGFLVEPSDRLNTLPLWSIAPGGNLEPTATPAP